MRNSAPASYLSSKCDNIQSYVGTNRFFNSPNILNKKQAATNFLSNNLKTIQAATLFASAKSVEDLPSKSLTSEPITEHIPEPPPIPDVNIEVLSKLNELGEATFTSLGLGGWTPVGVIQTSLEFVHVSLGIPWWGAIALGK